jgi:hypothetical protein
MKNNTTSRLRDGSFCKVHIRTGRTRPRVQNKGRWTFSVEGLLHQLPLMRKMKHVETPQKWFAA